MAALATEFWWSNWMISIQTLIECWTFAKTNQRIFYIIWHECLQFSHPEHLLTPAGFDAANLDLTGEHASSKPPTII